MAIAVTLSSELPSLLRPLQELDHVSDPRKSILGARCRESKGKTGI